MAYNQAASFSLALEKRVAMKENQTFHSTTVICVRRNGQVVMAADGQVTFGDHVLKHSAKKIRRLFRTRSSPASRDRQPTRSFVCAV